MTAKELHLEPAIPQLPAPPGVAYVDPALLKDDVCLNLHLLDEWDELLEEAELQERRQHHKNAGRRHRGADWD